MSIIAHLLHHFYKNNKKIPFWTKVTRALYHGPKVLYCPGCKFRSILKGILYYFNEQSVQKRGLLQPCGDNLLSS